MNVATTLEAWQSARDNRLWKIIISPEFGERVDLTQLTRDLRARMENDLGVRPEWVAVGHFNTEHPHVHVSLRGVAKDGEEIHLPPDYVQAAIFPCSAMRESFSRSRRMALVAAHALRLSRFRAEIVLKANNRALSISRCRSDGIE